MKGLLAIKVKENDVIVDIGAHFGLFTLESFALSNHTSKHYCFEPIPQIRAKLEDTVSGLTAAGSDQIKVFPFGLGKEDTSFQFTYVNLPSLPPPFFFYLSLPLSFSSLSKGIRWLEDDDGRERHLPHHHYGYRTPTVAIFRVGSQLHMSTFMHTFSIYIYLKKLFY